MRTLNANGPPTLPDDDLHVWLAHLDAAENELAYYRTLLGPEELARANRFYFEQHQARYVVGRGILRSLLSHYLGVPAQEIPISYGPHGKPALAAAYRHLELEFNLAHSHDRAIYLFGRARPLGVDLEQVRPLKDADDFAARFYSARECALIHSLTGDQKWEVFYKLWTCKEAYLKANGKGLTVPLQQVEINLGPDDTAEMISLGGEAAEAAGWQLQLYQPAPDYQAALAVQGPIMETVVRSI